jgi:hypothetical protein
MDSFNKDIMNIIFLDNDGVICLYNNWGGRAKKWSKYRSENPESSPNLKDAPVEIRFDDFDKKAIKILNTIIKETGAEIVVSSDWKLHANLEELGDYYEAQGIIKRPIAITPNLHEFDPESNDLFMWKKWLERKRIVEIKRYLDMYPNITNWVAVDDLNMSLEANGGIGLENFVLTPRSSEGIKQSGTTEKIIHFLTKN